ncbi:MAG: hypothetical protein LUH41_03020 [Clostridiales bacterium]|nr:hypothetical protein [Clostridiales bacterium]
MKKKYIVPDLRFESFVLSQSVAADCSKSGISVTESYVAMGLFSEHIPTNWSNVTTCTDDYDKWVEQGIIEEYCYWAGNDMKLFLS